MSDATPLRPIDDLIRDRDNAALTRWLEQTGLLDIADEFERLAPEETAFLFRLLPRDRAMAVFEALDPMYQQQVLDGLRDDRVSELIEEMDPDDRVRLLDEVPAEIANRLLDQISPEERALTDVLLGYPEDSVGRLMTPEFVSLRASMSVVDAIAKIRRDGRDAETVYALPVLDDQRHLVGITGLRALVLAEPGTRVGDLMETDIHMVTTEVDREAAARMVRDTGVIALPVVDSERRLVGVFTVDDAMSILEAEETEDFAFQGGHAPLDKPYLAVSAFGLARARGLWLLILIIAAALTVNVLQFFEDTLEEVVTLALFIPLLIDTGGNSGAQASTTVIRAMAIGEVRMSDLPRIVWREVRVGLLLGLMLGVAVFIPVVAIWGADLAFVISLTLVVICTWATMIGSILPLAAKRLGIDPAVVSAPVITTLADTTGLVIYFLIAISILGL